MQLCIFSVTVTLNQVLVWVSSQDLCLETKTKTTRSWTQCAMNARYTSHQKFITVTAVLHVSSTGCSKKNWDISHCCQKGAQISQGSVATHLRYHGIFSGDFTKNDLLKNLTVKNI